jgi:glucose-1-phosphate thymidylyltransferase
MSLKGVILSGGKGSRLSPITDNYPKQLLPILGKPILFHCIEHLRKINVKDIAIIVNPETGDLIRETVEKKDYPENITYITQKQPLGLAHAVHCAQDFVGNDDFIVLLGDNLFDKSLKELVNKFHTSKADSLILLKQVERPYDFGVAELDAEGKVKKIVEKPKTFVSDFAVVGVYLFKTAIFEAIQGLNPSQRGELEITDAIAKQVSMGQSVQTSILESYWFDSGTLHGLLDANKTFLLNSEKFDNLNSKIRDSYLLGNIAVGEGSSIENSKLMGPISIGKNVHIRDTVIGPFTTISDNCIIDNSELQEVVLMENSKVFDSLFVSSVIFKDSIINGEKPIINCLYKK